MGTKGKIEGYAKVGLVFFNSLVALEKDFPEPLEFGEKPIKLFLEKFPKELASIEMDNEAFLHSYTFQTLLETIAKKHKPSSD